MKIQKASENSQTINEASFYTVASKPLDLNHILRNHVSKTLERSSKTLFFSHALANSLATYQADIQTSSSPTAEESKRYVELKQRGHMRRI